ncbi:MAG: hypothetical protein VX394_07930 [Pseudomonadota bacterium]|nr:hypothetical protein [Pseudomonadota bacterium]
MIPSFDMFVGIDWSGARGPRLRGLQVAACRPGKAAPVLVPPPGGGYWTRRAVHDWLLALRADGHRVLAGIDFAFAYPRHDRGAYFPGVAASPATAPALWALVEELCADAEDFYGGPFYRDRRRPFHAYLNAPGHRGHLFESRRRLTELQCRRITAPSPVFNCVGPASVGIGSLAGMRLLHALTEAANPAVAWPFAPPMASLTVVEIFPRLYFKLVGADPRAWADPDNLAAAITGWDSAPPASARVASEDEADALIAAAALRRLADRPAVWSAPAAAGPAAGLEGWIFGVEWVNDLA